MGDFDFVRHVFGPEPVRRYRAPVRTAEAPVALIVLYHLEPALVHERVVGAAEQDQVVEARVPAP